MDIYKLKFTILQQEILNYLIIYAGESFSGRKLARALKVSPTAILNSIKLLKKMNLITIKKDFLLSISFNIENKKALEYKRIINLELLHKSGVVDFLSNKFPGSTIILFGSYAFGEDIYKESDIDIAIIGRKEQQLNLKIFEKKLKKEINLNFFPDFRKTSSNLRDSIINGITLHGHVML